MLWCVYRMPGCANGECSSNGLPHGSRKRAARSPIARKYHRITMLIVNDVAFSLHQWNAGMTIWSPREKQKWRKRNRETMRWCFMKAVASTARDDGAEESNATQHHGDESAAARPYSSWRARPCRDHSWRIRTVDVRPLLVATAYRRSRLATSTSTVAAIIKVSVSIMPCTHAIVAATAYSYQWARASSWLWRCSYRFRMFRQAVQSRCRCNRYSLPYSWQR